MDYYEATQKIEEKYVRYIGRILTDKRFSTEHKLSIVTILPIGRHDYDQYNWLFYKKLEYQTFLIDKPCKIVFIFDKNYAEPGYVVFEESFVSDYSLK